VNTHPRIDLLAAISLAILCTGCATTDPIVLPKETVITQQLNIDPKLLEECEPDLAPLEGRTSLAVLGALDKSQVIHQRCYNKHKELSDLIKKFLRSDNMKLQSQ